METRVRKYWRVTITNETVEVTGRGSSHCEKRRGICLKLEGVRWEKDQVLLVLGF